MRGITYGFRITRPRCRTRRKIKLNRLHGRSARPVGGLVRCGRCQTRFEHLARTGGAIGQSRAISPDDLMCGEQFNERGGSIGARITASGSGGYGVVEYRAYVVGHDGHFIDVEAMVCTDDAEAIEKAQRLADHFAVEIWSGERFVIRLEATTK
jgi:predicted Zn finger-like uncharacterized protein